MKNTDCFYLLRFLKIIIALSFLCSCSRGFKAASSNSLSDNNSSKEAPASSEPQNPTDSTTPTLKETLGFCSPLSFDKVVWDSSLNSRAQRNLAIALSLTGSFEGHSGWQNLTNDFDGQGMSAGLLNQTLGTGSLEPLLANYESRHPSEFAGFFSISHAQSFKAMIEAWKTATRWSASAIRGSTENAIDLNDYLDPTGYDNNMNIHPQASAINANATAAQWARSQLYQSNGNFIPQWKSELQNMLKTPNYVTLQIGAALKIHQRAILYMKRVGISDLRTYLLMFDIVTQNGGIQETRFQQWEQQMASQKIADIPLKLKALVDIRLQDTLPQWRDDVRSRKYAIIHGSGIVHGENRQLTKNYCYKSTDPI